MNVLEKLQIMVGWKPPIIGPVKINFDVAVKDNNTAWIGVVAREDNEEFRWVACLPILEDSTFVVQCRSDICATKLS